ncbi:MAG: rhodanese-like domain-containing protein [Verrucomicrobiota bacterium]
MNAWLKAPLTQALSIVLLGLGVGVAGNQLSPRGLPWITPPRQTTKAEAFISLTQARELWQLGGAFFLDARAPEDYAAGHIGNALNLPALSFARHFGEIAPMLTPESLLVLYCEGKECDLSHRLAATMRQQGYTNIHLLSNGWAAWRQAGLPTTKGGQK